MFENFLNLALNNLMLLVLRVLSTGSFPTPLSSKDEKIYLTRLKNGDEEARDVLIEHNLRLVAHIIKKYYSSTNDQDDLVSIGTIGLIKAIDTFDMDKGIKLSSYAARCIENEVLMYFRSTKKTSRDVSMNEPIDTDKEGNTLTMMELMSTEDTIIDDLDTKIKSSQLHNYIDEVLTDRERKIIILRYGIDGNDELTQREVAQIMNISRSYVSRIEKKALQKLRKKF